MDTSRSLTPGKSLRELERTEENAMLKAKELEYQSRNRVVGLFNKIFPSPVQKHDKTLTQMHLNQEKAVVAAGNETNLKILKSHLAAKLNAAKVELASKLASYEIKKYEELQRDIMTSLDHQVQEFDKLFSRLNSLNHDKVRNRAVSSLEEMLDTAMQTLEDRLKEIEILIRKSAH